MVGALCRTSHAEGNVPLRALCRIVHATSILVRDLILAGNVCEVCAAHAVLKCGFSMLGTALPCPL